MITAEDWDANYWAIFDEVVIGGMSDEDARAIAWQECTEQFGERPEGVVA